MRQQPRELSTDRLIQVDGFFFAPCKGIRRFIACGIRNPGGDFAYGIWNPEFWNQEYRSRLESRIQVLLTNTGIQYLSGIRNPQRGIQNPRLSRIPESGNFLLVESGILEVIFLMESEILTFGIRNTAQGIRNPQHGMQNSRLSWILLLGTRKTYELIKKIKMVTKRDIQIPQGISTSSCAQGR